MKRTYLNEAHQKYSEACQEEVREMMQHPLASEEKEQQIRSNLKLSTPLPGE